jgi:hypothetical protein
MGMLTFAETKLFTSLVGGYLSDDEYAALQLSIAANPEAGEIVRGSGGVRKLRWSGSGRGKRGGDSRDLLPPDNPRRGLDADGVRQERG